MVAAVCLPAEVFVFEGVGMGSVVVLPMRVELVELYGTYTAVDERGIGRTLLSPDNRRGVWVRVGVGQGRHK